MALPFAYQRYRRLVPLVHVPGDALSVRPTRGVPLIRGVAPRKVPAATVDDDADALVTELYPSRRPVTRTVIRLPRWAAAGVNVDARAPETCTPFASHWYPRVVPDVHEPGTAVSLTPTFGVPLIRGTLEASTPGATGAVEVELRVAAT